MADIRPFRALRYDTSKVKLADVVTQPYDKITPGMQNAYYEKSTANFVRFELADSSNPYDDARNFLAAVRASGVIRIEDRPALYLYEQGFTHPNAPQKKLRRRALITLCRLQ